MMLSSITTTSAWIVIIVAIGVDLWLESRKSSLTWSQYIMKRALKDKWFVLIIGAVFGILLTHFFWPKGESLGGDNPIGIAWLGLALGSVVGLIWKQRKR